ncbi:acetyl-CoA carboxylase biotin carboxyl carrier protein [Salibacterium qingdaonense]|uniref:Biotin carboxyl carrier protein of acetyl-CoA carboxylase n=1 Tax=Salibacterium qingdaonense TaxID=266892 RepID=A0A1I4IFT4_9BACI|nr:acetyl-CoA carboxylase biotin carboxyl carrier protein [Salibacterium qingdaonense]SFL53134.1 acetyl-CoA carboxylase biotin carboxyl carrier protein [Salibacterium qingdaonense]
MFTMDEIKELIRAVDESSVGELKIQGETQEKITIKKEGASGAAVQPAPSVQPVQPVQQAAPAPAVEPEDKDHGAPQKNDNLKEIVSPMVGTFYRAPSPEASIYVKEGDQVKEDSVVCIVEAMKLMNELEAEMSGEIVEVLVDDGELVEYGQPLFLVDPK